MWKWECSGDHRLANYSLCINRTASDCDIIKLSMHLKLCIEEPIYNESKLDMENIIQWVDTTLAVYTIPAIDADLVSTKKGGVRMASLRPA